MTIVHTGRVYEAYDETGRCIGQFGLRRINGAVCFSHSLKIAQDLRGRGYYKLLHAEKLRIARQLGFKTVLATVATTNDAEIRCLHKYGWTILATIEGNENPSLYLAMCTTAPRERCGGWRDKLRNFFEGVMR